MIEISIKIKNDENVKLNVKYALIYNKRTRM